jgi:hypothetical protein
LAASTRRWLNASLDGGEDLGRESVEADVGRPVASGPVAVELGLPGLGEHVEAEAEVGLVGEAVHGGRVAVDRQLERGLHLEVGVLPGGGLEIDHDQAAVAVGSTRSSVPTRSRSRTAPLS